MKSPLTISILVKNNADTIQSCLDSIAFLNCTIQIGDLGCIDETINKSLIHKPEIIRLSGNDDLSAARNELISRCKTEWLFILNPYETLLSGADILLNCIAGPSEVYKLCVLQNDLITKETRLWHKNKNLQFKNPVYETVGSKGNQTQIFLNSANKKNKIDALEICKKWMIKSPISPDPLYYMACTCLTKQNWDSFLNYAEQYLHQETKMEMSFYMTHYYLALVNCYVKKNYTKALQSVFLCIAKKPIMAEFWCLLGDVYYALNDYEKAFQFFQNGLIIGKKRRMDCEWFMEISKYEEYPKKMMEACASIKKQTSLYVSQ